MSSGDSSSESNSPGSNQMGADVDMDMDMDSRNGGDGLDQAPKNWVGGMAWM